MSKIAAEAAREICEFFDDPGYFTVQSVKDIISAALSQSLAARDKEIEELADNWDSETDTELCSVSEMCKILADELRALLKGKAI